MIKNLVLKTVNKFAKIKYSLEFNPKFEVKKDNYSAFFKDIMSEKKLYTVRISTLPENFMDIEYPHEEPHIRHERRWQTLYGYNLETYIWFNDNVPCSIDGAKNNIWYNFEKELNMKETSLSTLAQSMIDKDVVIVETGESLEYVKEILTGIKIPILYYYYEHFSTSNPGYHHTLIRNNYEIKFGKHTTYPYYIKMLETKVQENHNYTNFKDGNCLDLLSLEERDAVLKFYEDMHPDNEFYRNELLKYFKKCEEEMEKQKSLHKQQWIEDYEQKILEKLPKVLVKGRL